MMQQCILVIVLAIVIAVSVCGHRGDKQSLRGAERKLVSSRDPQQSQKSKPEKHGAEGGDINQAIQILSGFSGSTVNIQGPLDFKATNMVIQDVENGNNPPEPITEAPTALPTKAPTALPTEIPTEMPTELPSTAVPTELPSAVPTFSPLPVNASCACSDVRTEVVERKSSITNRTWMDRNLGASRRATSYDDPYAYGCLYQWGRGLDGAASVEWNSSFIGIGVTGTVGGRVSDPFPACTDNEKFVTVNTDWLSPSNETLWETGSPRDPCPEGYQVPSKEEWEAEQAGIANITDAYDKLGLTSAGFRATRSGSFDSAGSRGIYWSRTPDLGTSGAYDLFSYMTRFVNSYARAQGFSVRCIKI